MLELIIFACLICIVQLIGSYLRFLAFKEEMSLTSIRRLWKHLLMLSLVTLPVYTALFYLGGIAVQTYKAVLLLGWIPYQIIFVLALPGRGLQHLFVWGMSALWSFICHNWSSIVVALFLMGRDEELVLEVHAILYPLWFIMLLPLARKCFSRLLPAFYLFENKLLRIYTALLPTVMVAGFVTLIADAALWHSWEERIGRLLLPVAFFLSYHYILGTSRLLYNNESIRRRSELQQREIAWLQEEQQRVADSRQQAQQQQENLLHTYEKLQDYIQGDRISDALALISQQEKILASSAVRPYTDSPILNAAISIYLRRAEVMGLTVAAKVNLPKELHTSEDELAVLISNLLENALKAAAETGRGGELSFILQHIDDQCVLEITNPCCTVLRLDKDGLPKTTRKGHGLGMMSLRNFLKRYHGYADFTQERGTVCVSLYWEDTPC